MSQPGKLYYPVLDRLHALKVMAQNPDPLTRSMAELEIMGHLFEVRPNGRGSFAYVLQDNHLRLELPGPRATKLPIAHVQIRSEYLTSVGPAAALDHVEALLDTLGQPSGNLSISRLDLFLDFVASESLMDFPGEAWVKRGKRRHLHEYADRVTGITFAQANAISARIYDKTLEIAQKSHKEYLHPLWRAKGWDGETPVTRLEFQVRRAALPSSMCGRASGALERLSYLWHYLTRDWLRLAIPSESDRTRSRWPTHPWWTELHNVGAAGELDEPSKIRAPMHQAPQDAAIFRNALAALTSYMAKYQIHDYSEAKERLFQALAAHYDRHGDNELEPYLRRKIAEKTHRFRTRKP